MWRGNVVFARHAPGHGGVWQVMLFSPRTPRRLTTLRHGAIPTHCPAEPGGCTARPAHGEVGALDYAGGIVTFAWSVSGPGVIGEGAWEIRVDSPANGASRLIEASFGHEACTTPLKPGELEYLWPEAPVISGRAVLSPLLEGFDCFSAFGSTLRRYGPGRPALSEGRLETVVLGLAVDGTRTYGLIPAPAPAGVDSPSCSVPAPCSLEQIALPALAGEHTLPRPPFE